MSKSATQTARKAEPAAESINEIATLRIELVDTDPLIWREVEAPTSITLKVLHDIVQSVMPWFNSHLWEFKIGERCYGIPMEDDWRDPPTADAAKVRLRDILKPRKTVIDYLYDFGDSWEHRIVVTNIRPGDPDIGYPRYIGGEWNAPPEDCGGFPGFYNLLDALADEDHPDHAELSEWAGDYDPKALDVRAIKTALGRIAARRKAAKKRLAKR